jgi:hypothetical protein
MTPSWRPSPSGGTATRTRTGKLRSASRWKCFALVAIRLVPHLFCRHHSPGRAFVETGVGFQPWRRCGRSHQTSGNVTSTTAATSTIIAGTLNKSLISPYSTGASAPAPTPPV